jgi:hypothetical protein
MRTRFAVSVASCLLPLLLAGCGGALSAVRDQAAADFKCDASNIQVHAANPTGDAPMESGVYYAKGCDKEWRYRVSCNAGGYCPRKEGVDVKELLSKQASFDLTCDGDQLTISELNGDTFGVSGCKKKASYVLVCTAGRACRAVQNTQAQ